MVDLKPKVEIDLDEVVAFLEERLQVDDLKTKFKALKGIDYNPFNDDGDEHEGVYAEIHHNYVLVHDFIDAVAFAAQGIVVGGISLSNPQKHKAVVKVIDRAIRLPFFLEPFDGPLIDMILVGAVRKWNAVDWYHEGEKPKVLEMVA